MNMKDMVKMQRMYYDKIPVGEGEIPKLWIAKE